MDCSKTIDNRTKFCVGFLFSSNGHHVALVEKKRPAWQAGKMNGIGGGVEEGETALEAQQREFREETSYYFHDWERIGVMKCATCDVDIFRGFIKEDYDSINDLPKLIPEKRKDDLESEIPEWVPIANIQEDHFCFLHNVPWLVDFCLDTRGLNQDIQINYRQDG